MAKNQLGLDSAEVHKKNSVPRHAALCMALATWAEVWAYRRRPRLRGRSISAKLSALRTGPGARTIFASGPRGQGARRNAAGLASLLTTATRAA